MRYRIYILSILIFLISSTYAQLGVKVGIGASDIMFRNNGQTPYLGYEINSLVHNFPLFSFEAGLMGNLDLGKRIDLQMELLYSRQGLNYSTNYLYDDIKYKLLIKYLKMPFLFGYKISLKRKNQQSLFAGPYFSLKLDAVNTSEIEGNKEKSKVSNVKDTDFGIVAGYSVDVGLSSGEMVFGISCSYSLINMMDPVDGYLPWYYGPSSEYSRVIFLSISAGYRFTDIWNKNSEKK